MPRLALLFLLISAACRATTFAELRTKALAWTKPEGFLKYIQETDPASLGSFTLMRNSQSRQKSSPAFPRAIVFGTDAELVFAFNGNPAHKGYQSIEMFRFDPAAASYDFRRLDFSTGQGILSESNPVDCQKCHTARPHPIWDEYDFWPTAFGAHDDSIINFSGFEGRDYFAYQTTQFFQFGEFQANVSGHSRYSFLDFPDGSPVSPYSIREKGEEHRLRPNGRLTALLTRQHAAQLARYIHEHPRAKELAPKLERVLIGCDKGKPWPADPILRELGIEPADWSLVLEATKWSYFEGGRDLADFVATELYERLRGDFGALAAFRPVSEIGFSEPLFFATQDAYYTEAAKAIRLQPACETLK